MNFFQGRTAKLKVLILCSYPSRYITSILMHGSRSTHVSSWNINLIKGLSEIKDLELFIISKGQFFINKNYKVNNINFFYVSKIPFFDKYFPSIRMRRYQKFIDKINPDLVHGIGNEHLYPYFAMKSGYKNVLTIHGILQNIITDASTSDKIRLKLENLVFRKGNNFIAISNHVKQLINKQNPIAKICNINNSISDEFFNRKYLDRKKGFDLIMIGMIYPLKNTHLIIQIIINLKKHKKNIKIAILGGYLWKFKSYYDKILIDIQSNNLENNIIMIGQLDNDKIPNYISKSRVLLHLSKYETACMAFVESLSINIPIICSNVGNIQELKTRYNGVYILKNMDTNSISDEVNQILLNVNSKIINNHSLIKNDYSLSSVALKTYNFYKEIYLND